MPNTEACTDPDQVSFLQGPRVQVSFLQGPRVGCVSRLGLIGGVSGGAIGICYTFLTDLRFRLRPLAGPFHHRWLGLIPGGHRTLFGADAQTFTQLIKLWGETGRRAQVTPSYVHRRRASDRDWESLIVP